MFSPRLEIGQVAIAVKVHLDMKPACRRQVNSLQTDRQRVRIVPTDGFRWRAAVAPKSPAFFRSRIMISSAPRASSIASPESQAPANDRFRNGSNQTIRHHQPRPNPRATSCSIKVMPRSSSNLIITTPRNTRTGQRHLAGLEVAPTYRHINLFEIRPEGRRLIRQQRSKGPPVAPLADSPIIAQRRDKRFSSADFRRAAVPDFILSQLQGDRWHYCFTT